LAYPQDSEVPDPIPPPTYGLEEAKHHEWGREFVEPFVAYAGDRVEVQVDSFRGRTREICAEEEEDEETSVVDYSAA